MEEEINYDCRIRKSANSLDGSERFFIRSPVQKNYNKLIHLLDLVMDEVGNNEKHPLAPLLEILGNLVESYEKENFKPIEATPIEVLRHLMTEHKLTQKDMIELGSQGVVSEILSGKRELSVRQI